MKEFSPRGKLKDYTMMEGVISPDRYGVVFTGYFATDVAIADINADGKADLVVSGEYFFLDLFGNRGNSLFTKNRGIGTILNDD